MTQLHAKYYGIPPAENFRVEYRNNYTATAGQTIFPATYTIGSVDVYYNGSWLDPRTSFTAIDGQNVILTEPAVEGSLVNIIGRPQVALTDVYTKAETNVVAGSFYGTTTGTGNALLLDTTPVFDRYYDGMEIRVRMSAPNTIVNPTLNANNLGAKTIVREGGTALIGGDYAAGDELTLRYVALSDKFYLLNANRVATTPPQFDNSGRIATTSFVNRALGSTSGYMLLTGNYTMTAQDVGKFIVIPDGFRLTLPPASSVPDGAAVYFRAASGGTSNGAYLNVTDKPSISFAGQTRTVPAFVVGGVNGMIVKRSDGYWEVICGDATLSGSNQFSSQLGVAGYEKSPSGIIHQWGVQNLVPTPLTGATATVTMPIAFPTTGVSASVAINYNTPRAGGYVPFIYFNSRSQIIVGLDDVGTSSTADPVSVYWNTWGY